jgi:hypothetical protein
MHPRQRGLLTQASFTMRSYACGNLWRLTLWTQANPKVELDTACEPTLRLLGKGTSFSVGAIRFEERQRFADRMLAEQEEKLGLPGFEGELTDTCRLSHERPPLRASELGWRGDWSFAGDIHERSTEFDERPVFLE